MPPPRVARVLLHLLHRRKPLPNCPFGLSSVPVGRDFVFRLYWHYFSIAWFIGARGQQAVLLGAWGFIPSRVATKALHAGT